MKTSQRFICCLSVLAVGFLLLNSAPKEAAVSNVQADVLSEDGSRQWLKGNLHTHSLWSDGDDYLEMIALWYRDRDYDFLCFTDHNVLAQSKDRWVDIAKKPTGKDALRKLKDRFPEGWVDERVVDGRTEVRLKTFSEVNAKVGQPGKFLLIQGEEVTDRFGKYPIHLCAANVKELIPPMRGESVAGTIQKNVDALVSQRERTGQSMMIHLNHPNFGYAVTAEDLMRVRGEKFFEVYNGHPGVNNSGNAEHASTERMWDIILTKRLGEFQLPVMYGLATDDGHNYHGIPSRKSEPGRGWVMVLAEALDPESIIPAMERGDFYSTSGVMLSKVTSSSLGLSVEVKSEPGVNYRIEFIGTESGYDKTSEPVLDKKGNEVLATRRYSADIGKVFSTHDGPSASYSFTGKEIYVRARITSNRKHANPSEIDDFEQAWVQPVVGPAALKPAE
ncbi:MAG: hypothetical protein O2983_07395 [Planctomycetota bacterium]|nr:hypothetical protein [Planctomycetota bacterium]